MLLNLLEGLLLVVPAIADVAGQDSMLIKQGLLVQFVVIMEGFGHISLAMVIFKQAMAAGTATNTSY